MIVMMTTPASLQHTLLFSVTLSVRVVIGGDVAVISNAVIIIIIIIIVARRVRRFRCICLGDGCGIGGRCDVLRGEGRGVDALCCCLLLVGVLVLEDCGREGGQSTSDGVLALGGECCGGDTQE